MYQGANSQYLNFYGPPGSITTVPYYRVLQLHDDRWPQLTPREVSGKAVFVGFSERFQLEQKDGYYTVFSQASGVDISGVEIAATAFANLLTDRPVVPLHGPWYVVTLGGWGVLLGVVCRLLPTLSAAGSALGLSALYLLAVQYQFAVTGSWYPLIIPLLFQVPVAFFGAVLWNSFEANKERHNIRKAIKYYLPDRVIDQLAKSIVNVKASSQLVYGICLFTDAEQYTSLAETMAPQELGDFMNDYYAMVFEPVRRHGGIVSDVVGDSMLALWATTQPDSAVRQRACLAALDIASAVQQFKQTVGTLQLPTRIGLHAGHMLLGNVGALNHYEYRAIGDIVNTASRIEGLNKYMGTRILVSEEVLQYLDGFLSRELGTFLLVGKSKPLVIYELLCGMEEATEQQSRLCQLFAEALRAYRSQAWEEAITAFYALTSSTIFKEDGPSRFYARLCEQYRARPPGVRWDGVVRITSK